MSNEQPKWQQEQEEACQHSFEEAKAAHGISHRNFYIPWGLATKLSEDKWNEMCKELDAVIDKYQTDSNHER